MDSAPDRWGRRLMLRRESIRANKAGVRFGVGIRNYADGIGVQTECPGT